MAKRSKETEDWVRRFREAVEAAPEPKLLDFREIARRTGALARNLRYVLDHGLLGMNVFSKADKPQTPY